MYLYNYMYICTYAYIHTPHSGSRSIFSSTPQAATSTPHACTLGRKKEQKKEPKKSPKNQIIITFTWDVIKLYVASFPCHIHK